MLKRTTDRDMHSLELFAGIGGLTLNLPRQGRQNRGRRIGKRESKEREVERKSKKKRQDAETECTASGSNIAHSPQQLPGNIARRGTARA